MTLFVRLFQLCVHLYILSLPFLGSRLEKNTMKCNQTGVSTSSQPHYSKKTICIEYQLQVILKQHQLLMHQRDSGDKKKHPKKFQGPSHSRDSNNMPLVFWGWTYDSVDILTKPWKSPKNGDINLHFQILRNLMTSEIPGSNFFWINGILTNKKKHGWLHQDVFFPWWKTPFLGITVFSCWDPHPNSWKSQLSSLTSTIWCSWRLEMQLRWNWCLHCIDATSLSSWRW